LSKSRQWIVLSLVLMLLGGLLFAYKVVRLGYPPLPDQTSEQWIIQARLELHPEQGPVRASLLLPTRSSGYTVSDEHFVSRGFGLTIEEDLFRRQADWAIRRLDEPKTLYYRAAVITDTRQRRFANTPQFPPVPDLEEPWASAMADIMEEVRSESADIESFAAAILSRLDGKTEDENIDLFLADVDTTLDLARLAQTLLAGARIPTLLIHGVMLQNDVQRAAVRTMLGVYNGDEWLLFDPVTGH
jgi:hypothetical protein